MQYFEELDKFLSDKFDISKKLFIIVFLVILEETTHNPLVLGSNLSGPPENQSASVICIYN